MSKGFMWALGVIAAIITVFGGAWAMDTHYTPREIHKMTTEQIYQEFETAVVQIQQRFQKLNEDRKLEKARDNYWYWVKVVKNLRDDCYRNPNDQNLRHRLNRSLEERGKAEQYLKSLEE